MFIKSKKFNDISWGLDRIDQYSLPLNDLYRSNRSGKNVDVCILDTGIARNHTEFVNKNIITLYDFRNALYNPKSNKYVDSNDFFYGYDDVGTGTHSASIIGGVNLGVAHLCNLFSLKIFDRNLKTNNKILLDSLNTIEFFHLNKSNSNPTVVNLGFSSLPYSKLVENKITSMTQNHNIIFIASAGNHNDLAEKYFPGGYKNVICVGGTDINDNFAELIKLDTTIPNLSGYLGSNYGERIDILAPGVDIRGAWISEDIFENRDELLRKYKNLSGNSTACAFVTGVVCLYLQSNFSYNFQTILNFLIDTSSKNIVKIKSSTHKKTPNRLLRSIYTDQNIYWENISDFKSIVNEGEYYEFVFKTYGVDGSKSKIPLKFSISNGTLPNNLILSQDGKLYGQINQINTLTPGYINISSLPPEEKNKFPKNAKGYVKYNFSINVENGNIQDVKNFEIYVVDLNILPDWITDDNDVEIINLNDYFVSSISFYYKDSININLNDFIINQDFDNLNFSLNYGSLPDNLILSSNGILKGTIGPIYPSSLSFPVTAGSIWKTFYFSIRAENDLENIDKVFSITIYRDQNNNSPPQIMDNPSIPIGTVQQGLPFSFNFSVVDLDNDNLQFIETSADVILSSIPLSTDYYFGIPKGLFLDELNGTIQGIIDFSNKKGIHFFGLTIFDGWDYEKKTFFMNIDDISLTAQQIYNSIGWITTSGLLGELNETDPSFFEIKAYSTSNNLLINYSVVSGHGTLPDGLTLDTNSGLIKGKVSYVSATKDFNFRIRAYDVLNPNIFLERNFSIRVKKIWGQPISEYYVGLYGNDKFMIKEFVNLIKENIPLNLKNNIYRKNDENFNDGGKNIFLLGGLSPKNSNDIFDLFKEENPEINGYIKNFFKKIKIIIGDLKYTSFIQNNKKIYDLLYFEIYDENFNADGFDENNNKQPVENKNTLHQIDYFYPPSLNNWRKKLISEGTLLNNKEKKLQYFSGNLDFVYGIPVLFVNPDYGRIFYNFIKTNNIDKYLKNKIIEIDKLIIHNLVDVNNPEKTIINFIPRNVPRI